MVNRSQFDRDDVEFYFGHRLPPGVGPKNLEFIEFAEPVACDRCRDTDDIMFAVTRGGSTAVLCHVECALDEVHARPE